MSTNGKLTDEEKFDRAARLAAITRHPVWSELVAHYEERRRAAVTYWGERTLRGNPPTPEEAAEARGFWQGIHKLLREPEKAAGFVETVLEERKESRVE